MACQEGLIFESLEPLVIGLGRRIIHAAHSRDATYNLLGRENVARWRDGEWGGWGQITVDALESKAGLERGPLG